MVLACLASFTHGQQQAIPTVTGELRMWHKVTLTFLGPETSETAEPNPFTDYRLDVTFTHTASGKTYKVPGYYAADGDAANSGAEAGPVWRVHFAPDATGEWKYVPSFRAGVNVATEVDPLAGESAGYCDGETGSFTIQPTNKTGRDMRAKGRLDYVGIHHLRYAGTGDYFMKAGTDSPENLLAYADFDGLFKTDDEKDELIKTWQPHVADWQEGDPSWQGGKGKGLIGAINYLASEGINSISFLTMNINGDDRNVFPYLDYNARTRMDVSRLEQWETVFEHGTRKGMYLHFKTQETENEKMLDNGDTGNQRRLYYRELIARFGHHLAMNWNLGEEINDASLSQKAEWAQFFHDNDPYHHPIVIHNGASHFDMMGDASELTGFSLQMNESDFSDTFFQSRRYVKRSADFNRPWVVACDEPGDSRLGVRPDDDPGQSHHNARKNALWGNIMAGGAGCEFYFGYDRPEGDLTLQNFRSRDLFWDYLRYTLLFFEENRFPFEQMGNHNELVSGNGDNANRCLAKIGECYLVQLHDGGGLHTLDLTGVAGTFSVKWFNPRTGEPLIEAANLEGGAIISLGEPPNTPTDDWIILVKNLTGGSATNRVPVISAGPDRSAFLSGASVSLTVNGTATDDGLPNAFAMSRTWSMVSGPAPVALSSVHTSSTIGTFTEPGTYVLGFSVTDTEFTAYDEVTVTIVPSQSGPRSAELLPVDDAFLHEGVGENSEHLKVDSLEWPRVAYLQFDLSAVDAVPTHATLRITEGDNPSDGEMTIRIFAALPGEWNENSLNGDNAPQKGAELASFTGDISDTTMIVFDLGAHITGREKYTFIVEGESSERDVSFASKEYPVETMRPLLSLTLPPNIPPEFPGFAITTTEDLPATVTHEEILALASDAEGHPLSLVVENGSTSAGGEISAGEGSFTYTPAIDYFGEDSFLMTVQDSLGGTVSAVLSITVAEGDPLAGVLPTVEGLEEGGIRVRFQGLPGFGYSVERSADLAEWSTIKTGLRSADGWHEFLDVQAPGDRVFYRLSTP